MSALKIARYGLLTSVMLVLGLVERQFLLVPGIPAIRLGLSNTVLLYALCLMDAKSAWLLMGLKVLLGGFLYAGVSGMFYSFAGGALSMAAMLLSLGIKGVGLAGISVMGAVAHMAGQVLMSRLLLGNWAALAQAPILIAAAVVTGVVTGVSARAACKGIAGGNPDMHSRLEALGITGGKKP